MTKRSRAYRPSRRDIAAAFRLSLSITGRKAAARRIIGQCSGYESSEAFLIAVRKRAIEFGSANSAHEPGEVPELLPFEHLTDPALRAFCARWHDLSGEEQHAAWSALCGKPFHAELVRSAVARLDPGSTGSGTSGGGATAPQLPTGESMLPSDEDIP